MDYQSPHVWGGPGIMPMDFPHPPFTSPPATPMTPMTPAALNHHHHAFPIQYDVPHLFPPNTPHLHPPPPPPFPPPADYRLFALCQHLQTYSKISETDTKRWWEDFMTEFFHDNSTLVIETDLGEGTRKYHLARQWIPLYFQSLMENGVTSVHLDLGQCISTFHQSLQELECHSATMETNHSSPHPTKVCTNGSLVVDFSLEDKPRILSWYFNIIDHMEYIPRGNSASQGTDSGGHDNITIRGLLPSTQKLLREAAKLEGNNYHETPMALGNTSHMQQQQRWQDMPTVINTVSSGLEVMNTGQLEALPVPGSTTATMTTMMQQCMSPADIIPHSMAIGHTPPSTSSLVTNSSGNTGKSKPNRSSTLGGGAGNRKRQSPIPGGSGGEGSAAKATQQFMLVAAEAIQLKDADNLPLGPEERMIIRVDNKNYHPQQHQAPQTSPQASKSSPPNSNGHSSNGASSTGTNSINGGTSKLCHLNSHHHHNHEETRALSRSTLVDSSAQGVELMQGPNDLFETPLQPWGAESIGVISHSALASTR